MTNELQVELQIRVGEQECGYEFLLGPDLAEAKLPAWLMRSPNDPMRTPAVRAVKISGEEPQYPETTLRSPITVIVDLVIEADGRVSDVRALSPRLRNSPTSEIAEAAVAAVRTWQYRPAENQGQPVRSVQTIYLRLTPPELDPSLH